MRRRAAGPGPRRAAARPASARSSASRSRSWRSRSSGPFVEELLFRGLLTAALPPALRADAARRSSPPRSSRSRTSSRACLPPLFLLGLALALVYERVGSTLPGHPGSLPVQRYCARRGTDAALSATGPRCSTLPPRERAGQRSVRAGGARAHLGARRRARRAAQRAARARARAARLQARPGLPDGRSRRASSACSTRSWPRIPGPLGDGELRDAVGRPAGAA